MLGRLVWMGGASPQLALHTPQPFLPEPASFLIFVCFHGATPHLSTPDRFTRDGLNSWPNLRSRGNRASLCLPFELILWAYKLKAAVPVIASGTSSVDGKLGSYGHSHASFSTTPICCDSPGLGEQSPPPAYFLQEENEHSLLRGHGCPLPGGTAAQPWECGCLCPGQA